MRCRGYGVLLLVGMSAFLMISMQWMGWELGHPRGAIGRMIQHKMDKSNGAIAPAQAPRQNLSAGPRKKKKKKQIAVCIIGQASRLELESKIQLLFKPWSEYLSVHVFLVLQEAASFYVNPDQKRSNDTICDQEPSHAEIEQQLGQYLKGATFVRPQPPEARWPFPVQMVPNVRYWEHYHPQNHTNVSMRLGSHFQQFANMRECAKLVKDSEHKARISYEGVLKLRDDTLVLKPMAWPQTRVVLVKDCADWKGVSDKVVFAPRQFVDRVFEGPLEFAQLVNVGKIPTRQRKFRNPEQFLLACFIRNGVPFEKVSAETLPLVMSRCGGRDRNDQKSFCLTDPMWDCHPRKTNSTQHCAKRSTDEVEDKIDHIHWLRPKLVLPLSKTFFYQRAKSMPAEKLKKLYARVSGLIAKGPANIAGRFTAATAAVGDYQTRAPLRILVGVVTDSRPQTVQRAWQNLVAVSQMGNLPCNMSFAYIVYDDQFKVWGSVQLRARGLSIGLHIMEGIGAGIYNGFIGKFAHHVKLLPLLAGFDVLWTVDTDISFVAFNLHRYLETWLCAFETGPPLVSQPISAANTQYFYTLNAATWVGSGLLGELKASAVRSSYIETQMTFIDVGFFLWMVQSFVHLMRPYLGLATDWGIGRLWCKMAQRYAPNRTACAIIIEPMSHEDSRTISKSTSFRRSGVKFHALLERSEQFGVFFSNETWLPLRELSWCRSKHNAITGTGRGSYKQCNSLTKPLNCSKVRTPNRGMKKICAREASNISAGSN